ncbi:DUF2817 domain-containing protein [candidate division KSB1 bacterium]|nr:DUF2817 domain-containing protein [candidate division KSB1 bacterium]
MPKAFLKKFFGLQLLFLIFLSTGSAATLKTPGEACNFTRYSQHGDIAQFLSALSQLTPNISVQVVGKTYAVENYPAQDIWLCILTSEGVSNVAQLNREKPTLLITAAQHGNEQSAKEAALQLIRDLTIGELKPSLQTLNFLILPQVNPYGNWYDQRVNELDLDMNRDHIKLEAEGVQVIHRVFRRTLPEVTLDLHERGDNYYRVALGCVSNINIYPGLEKFARTQILARIEKILSSKGVTFHEYLVREEMGLNTASGANLKPEDTAGRQMLLRYSTTDLNDGRNSLGIYQTLSFIQEGASQHDLKTLKARTEWQTQALHAFVQIVAEASAEILKLVRDQRANLLTAASAYSDSNQVHLKLEYSRDLQAPTLTFKEFKSSDSLIVGLMKTNRQAGEALLESDILPYPYPAKQQVVTREIPNWFPRVLPRLSVPRPLGYIIPAKHADVIETLLRHGMEISIFNQDSDVEVEVYVVHALTPSKYDYLPPEQIDVVKQTARVLVKKGDYYLACVQPAANLIPCLLEPQSDYGLIRYWKLNLVPEKGDFFAFYRVVREQKLLLIPYQRWAR